MYFNNMKYISRFLFMQAFFPFFVEEKLIFVIGKINRESYGEFIRLSASNRTLRTDAV